MTAIALHKELRQCIRHADERFLGMVHSKAKEYTKNDDNHSICKWDYLKSLLLIVLVMNTSKLCAQPCGHRYLDSVFSTVDTVTIPFDIQPNYQNHSDTLFADIYTPVGDTATHRAAIIFIHGGGFVGGTRDGSNIPLMCQRLAKKGYIVASIDYRLGVADTSVNEKGKAQIRAVQDLKSFIRFTKQNASSIKVDTNKIFIAGSSAGGATSLSAVYMSYSERPYYMDTTGVGSIDGYGNLNGHTLDVNGVFSMWGAVGDTVWIKSGDVPVGCIQSIYDPCIPWTYSPSSCNIPGYPIYGSYSIYQRAIHLGIYSTVYGFNNNVHDFGLDDLNGLDTTIAQMSSFFYTVLCGTTTGLKGNDLEKPINVFPNPFTTDINIATSMSGFQYTLYNLHGQVVKQGHSESKIFAADLPKGFYILKVFNKTYYSTFKIFKENNRYP